MKRINIIFIWAVPCLATLMLLCGYVGVALRNDLGVILAGSACFTAIAGLLLSIAGCMIGIISIVTRIRRSTGFILPLINIALGIAYILFVFVVPIGKNIRHQVTAESQRISIDHKEKPQQGA